MREQKKAKNQENLENFEEIYIRTYQEFYEYVRILITDQRKVKELLILTYSKLYYNMDGPFGRMGVGYWLKEEAEKIAELKMGITAEQIKASHIKEKEKNEDILKDRGTEKQRLDETSIFLEIVDYLKLDENADSKQETSGIRLIAKNIFSVALLGAAIAAIVMGIDKIKYQIDIVRAPFLESMSLEEENSLEAQKNKKKHIKIGEKRWSVND